MKFHLYCCCDWEEWYLRVSVYWLRWYKQIGFALTIGPFHFEPYIDWKPALEEK